MKIWHVIEAWDGECRDMIWYIKCTMATSRLWILISMVNVSCVTNDIDYKDEKVNVATKFDIKIKNQHAKLWNGEGRWMLTLSPFLITQLIDLTSHFEQTMQGWYGPTIHVHWCNDRSLNDMSPNYRVTISNTNIILGIGWLWGKGRGVY